jgi:hypothetical protein
MNSYSEVMGHRKKLSPCFEFDLLFLGRNDMTSKNHRTMDGKNIREVFVEF